MALHGVVAFSFQFPRAEPLAVALIFQRRDGRFQHLNALAPGVRFRLGALGDAAQPPESPPAAEGDSVAALRNPYSPVPQSAQAASHAAARAVLHANLATVHIVQGDLAQASQCAHKALELQPDSRNALLCLVYLEIRAGNLDAAREILTKHVVPSQPLAPAAS